MLLCLFVFGNNTPHVAASLLIGSKSPTKTTSNDWEHQLGASEFKLWSIQVVSVLNSSSNNSNRLVEFIRPIDPLHRAIVMVQWTTGSDKLHKSKQGRFCSTEFPFCFCFSRHALCAPLFVCFWERHTPCVAATLLIGSKSPTRTIRAMTGKRRQSI